MAEVQQNGGRPDRLPLEVDKRLPPGWWRKVVQRQEGSSAGTYDVYVYSDDNKKFRSRKDVERFIEKEGRTDLNDYIFDFSAYGTYGAKPFSEATTPKGKSTPKRKSTPKGTTPKGKSSPNKKLTPKGKSPKVVSRKVSGGGKSPKSPKNALKSLIANKKKSAIKTLASKLVVKMTFVRRKRSAAEDNDNQMSDCSSDSEVDAEEVQVKSPKAKKAAAKGKKRKLSEASSTDEKKVDKSNSPKKAPPKSPRKSIENGGGDSPTKKATNGTVKGAMSPPISPSKRTSSRGQKSESSDCELSPVKRVRGRSLSSLDSPVKGEGEADSVLSSPRRGRARKESTTSPVKSPRSKSASSAGEDKSESQDESPSKERRTRKDSSMDISHTQVDGAVSESPIKRGRGRPPKKGRPRKDSVKGPEPSDDTKGNAADKETPKKQPGRRGAAKKDEEKEAPEGESSVDEAATQSPAPRPRGRPRKTPVRFIQSEQPDEVKTDTETPPPPAKGRRGRPRKTPVQSSAEDSKVEEAEPEQESVKDKAVKDKAVKGSIAEEVSETPKRGRGRPRKVDSLTPKPKVSDGDKDTPSKSVLKDKETPSKSVLKDKETPSKSVPKDKETPSKSVPKDSESDKKQPAETPKEDVKTKEADKTEEEADADTPARRGPGRPRKTPKVTPKVAEPSPGTVKRGRGRPKKIVAEPEPEPKPTATENKAETSEDDALPTLQFEGDEPKSPVNTTVAEEPPVLSLAGAGDTAVPKNKKAELKKAESDGELPPLVAVPVSPRQSSRKPKPKFDKDFISPTKKLIAYYEADRGKTGTKKGKDNKGKEAVSPPAKKVKMVEKARAEAVSPSKKKAAEKTKNVAPPPTKKTKAAEKVKVLPTFPLQKIHPKIQPKKSKIIEKEPILETLAAEEEGKISPSQQIFTDNTFELMSGLENTNCGLEMVPDLCNSLMEDVVGDGSVLSTMVDPSEADQAPVSIAERLSAVLMDHDYTKEFRRSLSCESLAMVASSSPKRKRSMSWTENSAQVADDIDIPGSEAQKHDVSEPLGSGASTTVVEKATAAADLQQQVARSIKKAKTKVGAETERGTIKRKATKEMVPVVKPSKRQKAAAAAAATVSQVVSARVGARGKSKTPEKVKQKFVASPKSVKPSILKAKLTSTSDVPQRKAHKPKQPETPPKAILKVPPPKVAPVKPAPPNASPPKRREPERPSPIKPKKVSLSLNLEVTKSLPENIFDVDLDEPTPSTSTDSAPEVVKVKTPEKPPTEDVLMTSEQPETETKSPSTVTPSPALTTTSPVETTPSPEVTTPTPAVTTPSPVVTTLAPAATTSSPAVATPSPTVTTPSPSTTTPSRRVSIGPVETHEIDQTKSPGPPSTTFDLAALAFVPPPSKQKQRKKSTEVTPKKTPIKKVGQWSFTPLKSTPQKPPQSPETPTSGGPKSILKKNLKPGEES